MFTEEINSAIAILLLRTVAGSLFFFQGYDKLVNIKIENVVRTFNNPASKFQLSNFYLKPAITIASLVEMIGGALLIVGLYKNIALYLIAFDLIVIGFIFSAIKAMWDMQFYFPRLILVAALLLLAWIPDIFSLDHMLFRIPLK
jgi:putative oxidoreductase